MNICRKLISGNVGRATHFTYCSRYSSTLPPAISAATRRYSSTLPPAISAATRRYSSTLPPAISAGTDKDFQAAVTSYTNSLRGQVHGGISYNWDDMRAFFEKMHLVGINKIQMEMENYTIHTLISVESYMHLYLRCTYADLRGVFDYFLSNGIRIAVGKYATEHVLSPHFIRMSALSVSNKPNIMLRADASVIGRQGGYGFIFTDSDDRWLDWDLGHYDDLGRGLGLTDRVTLLELHAIDQALSNYKFNEAGKHGCGLRILSDCYNAVDILNGKPVVTSTTAPGAGVKNTYYDTVMNYMCSIGIKIKRLGLSDYSVSHMYRELNGSGDFLSQMGRLLKKRPTGEELTERGKNFNIVRQFNKPVPLIVSPSP